MLPAGNDMHVLRDEPWATQMTYLNTRLLEAMADQQRTGPPSSESDVSSDDDPDDDLGLDDEEDNHRADQQIQRAQQQPHTLWLVPGMTVQEVQKGFSSGTPQSQIKELRISGELRALVRGVVNHQWLDAFLPILHNLNSVRTLHLEELSWGHLSAAVRECLLSHFKYIDALWLEGVDFWNSWQFLNTLDAFHNLKDLDIHSVDFRLDNYTFSQVIRQWPLELTLAIGKFAWSRCLTRWVLGDRSRILLEEAYFDWRSTEGDLLVHFARALAPKIRRLVFHQHIHQATPEVDNIDPRLYLIGDEPEEARRSLTRLAAPPVEPSISHANARDLLKLPLERSWMEAIDAEIAWTNDPQDMLAVELLCTLISPQTTDFELLICMDGPLRFALLDWTALDAILAEVVGWPVGSRQPQLVLAWPFTQTADTYGTYALEGKLPRTVARGVFQLKTTTESRVWRHAFR